MWEIETHMRKKFKHDSLLQEAEEDEDASHHHHDPSPLLPAEMTLMPAYRQLFRELSTVVRGLWRPSDIIRLQVADLSKQHRLRDRMSIGVHSKSLPFSSLFGYLVDSPYLTIPLPFSQFEWETRLASKLATSSEKEETQASVKEILLPSSVRAFLALLPFQTFHANYEPFFFL